MKTELLRLLEPYADGDWTYECWPEFHPIAEYDLVQQQYLDRCREFPGVRSVWTVGEIGVAGVSDIDFVVGFADPLSDTACDLLSIHRLDAPGPYISLHQPLFLSDSLLRELFTWRYVWKARCLYGDPTGIQVLPSPQLRIMRLLSLCDIFFQLQPRLLLRTLLSRHMHVRGTLCQVHALKHTLRRYREATRLTTTKWDGFVEEFADFRHRWFELGSDRIDRLRVYVTQSVAMLFELMEAYQQALADQGWFRPAGSEGVVHFFAPGCWTRFVARWDCQSALAHTLATCQHPYDLSLELPLAFAEPLRSHVDQDGLLSSHVKQYFWPKRHISRNLWRDDFSLMAARDARTRNAHVEFLFRNGLLWNDANFSSLGLRPNVLTDRSLRGRLRLPYRRARRWWKIVRIAATGWNE